MSVALPKERQSRAQVASFAPAEQSVGETGNREALHCLNANGNANANANAYAAAEQQFVDPLETFSQRRPLKPSEADIMGALARALRCVIEATRAKDGRLLICDASSGDLISVLAHGDAPENRLLWQRAPAVLGLAHRAASHRRAAIVNYTSNDERIHSGFDVASGFRTRSLVAASLLDGDEVLGFIEVVNKKNGELFSFGDQYHLTVMANLVSPLLIQLRELQAEKLAE